MQRTTNRFRTLAGRILVSLVAIVFAAALHAQNKPLGLTTLCAVANQPEKFDGQSITVRANVQSDGVHGSSIYDESCKQYGVLLFLAFHAQGEEELDAALNWCHLGTRGKIIVGTFTGVFHFKPVFIGDPDRRTIKVDRIDGLVLKSTKAASASFPTPCPDAPPVASLVQQPGQVVPQSGQAATPAVVGDLAIYASQQQVTNLRGRILADLALQFHGAGVGPKYQTFIFGVEQGDGNVQPVRIAYAYFGQSRLPSALFDYTKRYELKAIREMSCDESVEGLSWVKNIDTSGRELPPTYVLRVLDGVPEALLKPEMNLPCYTGSDITVVPGVSPSTRK